jgi:hypothetical protein
VERGNHAELYALSGRYRELYDKQHAVEANLFLAPGEGDVVPESEQDKKEAVEPSAASMLRGGV